MKIFLTWMRARPVPSKYGTREIRARIAETKVKVEFNKVF